MPPPPRLSPCSWAARKHVPSRNGEGSRAAPLPSSRCDNGSHDSSPVLREQPRSHSPTARRHPPFPDTSTAPASSRHWGATWGAGFCHEHGTSPRDALLRYNAQTAAAAAALIPPGERRPAPGNAASPPPLRSAAGNAQLHRTKLVRACQLHCSQLETGLMRWTLH